MSDADLREALQRYAAPDPSAASPAAVETILAAVTLRRARARSALWVAAAAAAAAVLVVGLAWLLTPTGGDPPPAPAGIPSSSASELPPGPDPTGEASPTIASSSSMTRTPEGAASPSSGPGWTLQPGQEVQAYAVVIDPAGAGPTICAGGKADIPDPGNPGPPACEGLPVVVDLMGLAQAEESGDTRWAAGWWRGTLEGRVFRVEAGPAEAPAQGCLVSNPAPGSGSDAESVAAAAAALGGERGLADGIVAVSPIDGGDPGLQVWVVVKDQPTVDRIAEVVAPWLTSTEVGIIPVFEPCGPPAVPASD